MEAPHLCLQGALALNCPGCGTKVADGTSICPKCDYIIDASFLSTERPSDGADREDPTGVGRDHRKAPQPAGTGGTGQRPAVTSTGTRRVPTSPGSGSRPALKTGTTGSHPAVKSGTGSRPALKTGTTGSQPTVKSGTGSRPALKTGTTGSHPSVKSGTGSRPALKTGTTGSSRSVPAVRPAAPQEAPKPEVEEEDWRIPAPPPAPAAPKSQATDGNAGIVAPEEIIADTRAFIGELGRSDKIAFGSACLIIISCFLPWKETAADGEILGLMSAGVGALLGAALVIGAIFVRKRNTLPKLNASVPWMVQLGVSFFCIIFTLVYIKVSLDTTQVQSQFGNAKVWVSSPSFGVFLGLFGALGALVGSVMGLRERS